MEMNVRINPINDHILVKPDDVSKTKGGIYIPDTAKNKSLRGEVIAVGPGPRMKDGTHRPMEIKVGDRILWNEYAGAHADFAEQGLLMIKEENVLGWVE
jgi:chaperonin GroES